MKIAITLFIFLILPIAVYSATWQDTLEVNFDLVSTFDELQDWEGTQWSSSTERVFNLSDMPKKLDGSQSIWQGYTHFNDHDAPGKWITNHGNGNAWSGVKSMIMDIGGGTGNTPGYGPERFIAYFGNGSRTSGYTEVYIFFMVKIDPAQWPTSSSGSYSPGGTYKSIDSWKFFNMCTGWKSAGTHGDSNIPRANYGWHQRNTHLKPYTGDGTIRLRTGVWYEGDDKEPYEGNSQSNTNSANSSASASPSINSLVNQGWFGVEIRYKLDTNTSDGPDDGEQQIWLYDSKGNAHEYINAKNMYWQHTKLINAGDKINKFWIGGNNSNEYTWGSGMVPEYYVDDFIIDDQRIGPKYFELLSGGGGGGGGGVVLLVPQISTITIQ